MLTALEQLGFGPCYHMRVIVNRRDVNEIKMWYDLGQGSASLDDLREVLKDFNSFLDFPVALNCDKMYEAYPDAKFILSTRDPAKWAKSMEDTLVPVVTGHRDMPNPTPFLSMLNKFYAVEIEGKLFGDLQGAMIAHNQRVRELIPADKLLEYDVSQGWDPLVRFLGVEKPDTPFPHLNTTEMFHEEVKRFVDTQPH